MSHTRCDSALGLPGMLGVEGLGGEGLDPDPPLSHVPFTHSVQAGSGCTVVWKGLGSLQTDAQPSSSCPLRHSRTSNFIQPLAGSETISSSLVRGTESKALSLTFQAHLAWPWLAPGLLLGLTSSSCAFAQVWLSSADL